MLDIVDRRAHGALERRDDAAGDFRSLQTAEIEHHADHGNVDGGENIDRHVERRHRPQNRDQEGEHDKGEGPLQRDADNPGHGFGYSEL